jgi:uncharacterized protein (DUF305 family)
VRVPDVSRSNRSAIEQSEHLREDIQPMRRIVLAVAAMALLAACGQAEDNDTRAPAAPQPNQADVTFTQRMIPHHQQAIKMAEAIKARTTRPELVKLAGTITTTQGEEIARMQGWLRAWGKPEAMAGMDHDQTMMLGMMGQGEMDQLMGLKGARFDLAFVDMMTRHHRGAIQMATTELKDGSLPEAKQLAQQIISAQQREVSQLAAWKRSWA